MIETPQKVITVEETLPKEDLKGKILSSFLSVYHHEQQISQEQIKSIAIESGTTDIALVEHTIQEFRKNLKCYQEQVSRYPPRWPHQSTQRFNKLSRCTNIYFIRIHTVY